MASVTITIPDPLVPRLRAAMRDRFPEFEAMSDANAFKASTGKLWQQIMADYERRATELQAEADKQAAIQAAYNQAIDDAAAIG